jgi:hypothetical protein
MAALLLAMSDVTRLHHEVAESDFAAQKHRSSPDWLGLVPAGGHHRAARVGGSGCTMVGA